MYSLPFVTVDVFTTVRYEGNPLSIIQIPASLRHTITQAQKQAIAAEFNLSESIFLHEALDPSVAEWTVDIFTSEEELPFAGHPVIGCASFVLNSALRKGGRAGNGRGKFITKAGVIDIVFDGEGGVVQATIPHNVHIHQHIIGDLELPIPGLSSIAAVRKAELQAPIVSIVKGMTFLLVRLEDLQTLGSVEMDGQELSFHGLLDAEDGWREGFVAKYYYVVLAEGGGEKATKVRTRMIEVSMEDPATGSAASALACFLSLQRGYGGGIEIEQGVEMGRRSVIGVEVQLCRNGRSVEGVRLSGSAVMVMEGSLRM